VALGFLITIDLVTVQNTGVNRLVDDQAHAGKWPILRAGNVAVKEHR
jgi:hypothetical protein